MKQHRQISLILTFVAMSQAALADEPAVYGYGTQAQISDQALEWASGLIGINMSAGDSNIQLNARALAITVGQGVANTELTAVQSAVANGTLPDRAISEISGNALGHASGLVSINQASGVGNTQLNAFSLTMGSSIAPADDQLLGAASSGASSASFSGPGTTQERRASITGNALANTSGIVQINQLAGSGNATRNNFALSINTGALQPQ